MIVRDEKRKSFWLKWLRGPSHSATRCGRLPGILDSQEFEFALRKEISRLDRRTSTRECALLLLKSSEGNPERLKALAEAVRARLRVTDELGYWRGELCALLPETGRVGAPLLGRQLEELAAGIPCQLTTEVQVYPWDDRIVSRSDELTEASSDALQVECDGSGNPESRDVDTAEAELARREFLAGDKPIVASPTTPLWKRGFDLIASGAGLILLSPILAGSALAIRLDSRGPVFFSQAREGKDGVVFQIYKFRTMRPDAEQQQAGLRALNEQDGPAFKIEQDPRVTAVGKFLRKTCIDELPQLLNVLRGEMSIVGPRPLPVHESYASLPWQRHRLTVLPGLTCIWQVEGARKVKFDQWMRMDLEYIHRRSFWFDLKILFRTLLVVLLQRGSV